MSGETITVYKYHKYNLHLINLLTLNRFYCASSKELNDPFDGAIQLSKPFIMDLLNGQTSMNVKPDEFFTEFYKKNSILGSYQFKKLNSVEKKADYLVGNATRLNAFTNYLLDHINYRIISFTGTNALKNESLMWSHYADSFKGVRLEFTFPVEFRSTVLGEQLKIEDVVPIEDGKTPIVSNEIELRKGLLSKYSQWKYENEKRILISKVDKSAPYLTFRRKYLTGIAFGLNMHHTDIFSIMRIIRKFKYTKCKFTVQQTGKGSLNYEVEGEEMIKIVEQNPYPFSPWI